MPCLVPCFALPVLSDCLSVLLLLKGDLAGDNDDEGTDCFRNSSRGMSLTVGFDTGGVTTDVSMYRKGLLSLVLQLPPSSFAVLLLPSLTSSPAF